MKRTAAIDTDAPATTTEMGDDTGTYVHMQDWDRRATSASIAVHDFPRACMVATRTAYCYAQRSEVEEESEIREEQ